MARNFNRNEKGIFDTDQNSKKQVQVFSNVQFMSFGIDIARR